MSLERLPVDKRRIYFTVDFEQRTAEARFANRNGAQPWQQAIIDGLMSMMLNNVGWQFSYYDERADQQRIQKIDHAG